MSLRLDELITAWHDSVYKPAIACRTNLAILQIAVDVEREEVVLGVGCYVQWHGVRVQLEGVPPLTPLPAARSSVICVVVR